MPQFFDKWWKYDARPDGWTVSTRHLELARRGIVARHRLLLLLEQTNVSDEIRERIRGNIARDFGK